MDLFSKFIIRVYCCCTACDPHCKSCSMNGADRCDTHECDSNYGYKVSTQTCLGKYLYMYLTWYAI